MLVKENHLRVAGGISPAVALLRARADGFPLEVEAETLEQVGEALAAGVERILLDNMTPDEIAAAVDARRRPRRARGLGRRLARDGARVRRDRRRLHLRRRADARRALAPRLPGGAVSTATFTALHEEIRALARSATPSSSRTTTSGPRCRTSRTTSATRSASRARRPRPTRRRSSSAASTSWPRPPRSSARRRRCCCPISAPAARSPRRSPASSCASGRRSIPAPSSSRT